MIFDSKEVSQSILENIKKETDKIPTEECPTLAIIRIGDDIGAISYEKSIKKLLKPLNIKVNTYYYESTVTQTELIDTIKQLNQNPDINSILILRPVPKHLDIDTLSTMIKAEKDVDASNPLNLGKVVLNDKSGFIPCTAEAVLELLDFYNLDVKGKDIVIINNSDIIGKPLSLLLTNRFATITVCHVYTKDLAKYTKNSDIIITAAGVYGLIKPEIISDNSTLIDLAVTQKKDKDGNIVLNENNKAIRSGDSLETCKDKAANIISLSPGCGGGIGPITTALLAKNILKSYKLSKGDLIGSN